MSGMNAQTGRRVDGVEHLRQSLHDILSTPIGSRVCRRDYGSRLPRLIDAPINGRTITDIYAATAEAIARWEPRFSLKRVRVTTVSTSTVELKLEGYYVPLGAPVSLQMRMGG